MAILAYITDLFFQAKVGETAHQVGADLKIVTSLYKFLPELNNFPSMVLIDLNAEGISPSALISQIKEQSPDLPVVVYASHVQDELMQRAIQAGANEVLPKSKLSRDLPKLLSRFK
ncbi:MAG: response regulator [Acidobacteriota bacterium]